jgi:hypothetical protein
MTDERKRPGQGAAYTGANETNCGISSTSNAGRQAGIPEDVLAAMRCRLVDYLAALGVELRKSGTRLVGRCPVHEDRSPSFDVFGASLETCGCYPCGFTGDVFKLSRWLGRSSAFPEAARDVASVLGVFLPQGTASTARRPATAPQRPARKPEPPFKLADADRQKHHAARLAFSDALDGGTLEPLARELGILEWVFRWCAMGQSGLGWIEGKLAYLYPEGIKLRNPEGSTPRFRWKAGKATVPWRSEWIQPETATVYLTEGESDCLALVAAGLESDPGKACVAIPGAEGFKPEWAAIFDGKRAVLCFDFDGKGREATAKVAAMLKGHAAEILTWKGPARHV